MTDKSELLPCPFCGGEAEDYTRLNTGATADFCGAASHWVGCTGECGAATCMHEEMADAIKAWNIRTALAPTTQGTDGGLAHDIERLVAANTELATENERLRTDRKAVLEEAAKVAREYVCKNQAWSTPAASLGDHIADEILAAGAGK